MSANKNSAENESGRNKWKEVVSDNMEVPPVADADPALEDLDSDDKQRKALGDALGLDPLQVKFWFQNKRTQVKNEKLRADNARYKEALSHATCPTCGGPSVGEMSFYEQHLRIENTRLREEIQRMSGMTTKMMGEPVKPLSYNHMPSCTLDLGGGTMEHGQERL
ncbi:Homeobox-like domain superfamily [Sesbania bispinosa]|nr:Homeobox-like domain superfamily [Sesbania bispinosa]